MERDKGRIHGYENVYSKRARPDGENYGRQREKQLEKVLLNAAHIRGSIEGIAGMDVDLNLLPQDNSYLLGHRWTGVKPAN